MRGVGRGLLLREAGAGDIRAEDIVNRRSMGRGLDALHEEVEGRLGLVEKWTTRDLWMTHLSLDTVARIQKGIEGLLQCDVEVREMYGVADSSYPESL